MILSDYFALKSGNQASLVRALGLPQTTVAHWASRSRSVPAEYCVSIEQATGGTVTRKDLLPNTWSAIWPELAAAPVDHSAELRAALAETRIVFRGEPMAADVLNYLDAVLAAGAQVPAQTGIAPAAAPVADPDLMLAAARQAVMHQARADVGLAAPDSDAKKIASPASVAFERAAAAMNAESFQMLADAKRSVAARAGAVISKLVVEVDTTQLDAALAKAEQLKVLLAGLVSKN